MAEQVIRQCKNCGKIFSVTENRLRSQYRVYGENACAFCCQGCVREWRKKQSHELRICKICGKEFSFLKSFSNNGRETSGQVCSAQCRAQLRNRKVEIECPTCGKKFKVFISQEGRKYCSLKCAGIEENKIKCECVICGREYEVVPSRIDKTRCCSIDCRILLSAQMQRKYAKDCKTRFNYKSWEVVRKQVISRDGGKCARCSKTGRLEVHHIVPWRKTKDDSPNNLITLCHECHFNVEYLGATIPARNEVIT